MPGAARDALGGLRDADHGGRDAPPYPLLPSAPCKNQPLLLMRFLHFFLSGAGEFGIGMTRMPISEIRRFLPNDSSRGPRGLRGLGEMVTRLGGGNPHDAGNFSTTPPCAYFNSSSCSCLLVS